MAMPKDTRSSRRATGTALSLALLLAAPLTGQGTREVSGVVVDEDDRPLAGVAVCPFDHESDFTVADLLVNPAARTGPDGTFTLQWDPSQRPLRSNALFVADGRVHVAAGLAYVDMTPIVLPRGRTLAGRVRDVDGKPVAGVRVEARDWLTMGGMFGPGASPWSTAPEPRTAVRTDEAGRFVLVGTCESAIHLEAGGLGFAPSVAGPLAAGESWDVVVERAPIVTVQVLAEDGAPLPTTRLALHGRSSTTPNTGGTSDSTGRWQFTWTGPCEIVALDEYRPMGSVVVAEPSERVQLTTRPAAADEPAPPAPAPDAVAVRGRVLDGDVPMPGAWVSRISPDEASRVDFYVLMNMRGAGAVRTAADGTFILHLSPGSHALAAGVDGLGRNWRMPGRYRNPTPVRIEVQAGAAPQPVDLRMQPLFEVRGRVEGAGLPRGCMVWFKPTMDFHSSGDEWDFQDRFPLRPDGTFVARGLQTRRHQVCLLVPRGFRQGLPDKVPVAEVEVKADAELRVAVARVRPTVAGGVVRGDVPFSRLAVLSLPENDASQSLFGCVHYWGPVVPVQRDGGYRLAEPPGRRALLVVDIATGVVLHRGETREVVAGSHRAEDFELRVHPLDLRARGLRPGSRPWVDIVVADANWPAGLGQMVALGDDRQDCGLGIALAPAAEEPVRIWLAGPARFILRQSRGIRADGKDVLDDVRVDPREERSVELQAR